MSAKGLVLGLLPVAKTAVSMSCDPATYYRNVPFVTAHDPSAAQQERDAAADTDAPADDEVVDAEIIEDDGDDEAAS